MHPVRSLSIWHLAGTSPRQHKQMIQQKSTCTDINKPNFYLFWIFNDLGCPLLQGSLASLGSSFSAVIWAALPLLCILCTYAVRIISKFVVCTQENDDYLGYWPRNQPAVRARALCRFESEATVGLKILQTGWDADLSNMISITSSKVLLWQYVCTQ